MNKKLKNLPIGVQDFKGLLADNFLYVDKTATIYKLVTYGKYFFLSRPRRFGKSLLLSTLKQYFLGRKELFAGLEIEKHESEWTEHPVLYLDLNTARYNTAVALEEVLNEHLVIWERWYGAETSEVSFGQRFGGVIRRACEKSGQKVVILVDEYDKPMLQAISNDALSDNYRSILKGFYGALKSMDAYIRFALLTGVSKFSKVSIFSDLNNLKDISMDERYYDICGISKEDLQGSLRPYVERLAEKRKMTIEETYARLKRRYDGYHFTADSPGMYNPYSILNTFDDNQFGSYWFETATPSFLVELLKRNNYNLPRLSDEEVEADALNSIDNITANPIPVLFQSGYLTIKGYNEEFGVYRLGFPNDEVREGFFRYLMPYYTPVEKGKAGFQIKNFVQELRAGEVTKFMTRLSSFFANTPYELVRDLENHYQNVLYILSTLCGIYTRAEYHTSEGRIDMTLETDDYVYIFEFKLDKSAEQALQQIRDKHYAQPFASSGKKLICIGANFSSQTRNIDDYKVEEL